MKNSGVWKARKQGQNVAIRLVVSLDRLKARRGYYHRYVSKEQKRKNILSFNFA